MRAEIIVLADRMPAPRPSAAALAGISRLKRYALLFITAGSLRAFTDNELLDMEHLILEHSMVVQRLDGDGEVAGEHLIFID